LVYNAYLKAIFNGFSENIVRLIFLTNFIYGVLSLRRTRENPADFPHPASLLPGQALQGSAEKTYNFNLL
jgi:hypothetical protein